LKRIGKENKAVEAWEIPGVVLMFVFCWLAVAFSRALFTV
tara:strand:- start:145 stop:264 length:120 start_codon:yes stop_codon:yes gene_type:complete